MFDQKFDAVLHHWCLAGYRSPDDVQAVLIGVITADRKGRFDNGRWIMTSVLVSPLDQIAEGAIVQTLNSRYLLGEPLASVAILPGTRQ